MELHEIEQVLKSQGWYLKTRVKMRGPSNGSQWRTYYSATKRLLRTTPGVEAKKVEVHLGPIDGIVTLTRENIISKLKRKEEELCVAGGGKNQDRSA